jgi:ABC-type Mn2+/Zn2+ transport system ATPase subunit
VGEPLFVAEGVAIGYRRPILEGVSFAIQRGEYWGVFGPNGAGKTTLIKTLLGVVKPLAGEIRRAPSVHLGYVPQLTSLRESLPLSVRQVVELGALDMKSTRPVSEVLERVGLAHLERAPFASLSGGQRQRVMVARALHRGPDLLVLDEPTNGVDLITRHALRDLTRELNAEGMAVLLITHLLGEIGPEVTRFLWLDSREGLFLGGPREEVLASPELSRAYGVGLRAVDVAGESVLTWVGGGDACA